MFVSTQLLRDATIAWVRQTGSPKRRRCGIDVPMSGRGPHVGRMAGWLDGGMAMLGAKVSDTE